MKYVIAILIAVTLIACGVLKRSAIVGGGSGTGAAVGSLAGPAGAIGGAVVGGVVTNSMVESDASEGRAERMENRVYGTAPPPAKGPSLPPWWAMLAVLWVWLRRAHIMDALTGKEPRLDALMRALGLRTHKTPIPARNARAS